MQTTIIERELYTCRILQHTGNGVVKVLTGHRRSGKSYLMLSLIKLIKRKDKKANIIYLNKEEYEFDYIKDYHALQAFFDAKCKKHSHNYFFVDEIQEIAGFEKCIRSILAKKQADIYISGSNARMLSGDLATTLSGRYIEIRVHPLSYAEFLLFFRLLPSDDAFYRYLKQGGMPGLININPTEEAINDYLKGILSTVLLKDVVARYNIRNVAFLENLVKFLADNIGSLLSAKSISDFLKSQRQQVSPNIVLDYLSHLCSAYIINKVPRMDINGKKIFEINDKYYFEDIGLRNTYMGYRIDDIAKILENIVYKHLIIAGYKVAVGQRGGQEIDFVAESDGETIYVQVCYMLTDKKVIHRKFGNLLDIPDNYKKYVVSMEKVLVKNTYKGIIHYTIPEFCLFITS